VQHDRGAGVARTVALAQTVGEDLDLLARGAPERVLADQSA
jgi:hypothetical protein